MAARQFSIDRSDVESPIEKMETGVAHKEHGGAISGLCPEDASFLNDFPEERKKKLMRKVDVWHNHSPAYQ